MRDRTCSLDARSSTTVATPARFSNCDNNRPDGPPPMIATSVFMAALLQKLTVLIVSGGASDNGIKEHAMVKNEHAFRKHHSGIRPLR
jgi:hypothetical protein